MEKGKLKKEEKYFSVLLVPHFSAKVKVLKISALYAKFIAMLALFLVILISIGFFVVYTTNENSKLKKDRDELLDLNLDQQNLLKENSEKIGALNRETEDYKTQVTGFTEKYKELTDKYITGSINTVKTNRSGDNIDRSFEADLNNLKDLMDSFSKNGNSTINFTSDLSDTDEKLKEYIDSVPTLWPASGPISSKFGGRKDPFLWSTRFHQGLDIAAQFGTKIYASAAGKITFSGWSKAYGNNIIIDHGNGITTFYAHASKLLFKVGKEVKKGDVIARVGSSGRSTGAHLHFEVRINSNSVDPLKYLDEK